MFDGNPSVFRLFGTLAKVEEQDDGTIKVYGIASSGSRDVSGEIVQPDAMKNALPDYSKFPALREMHQPLAAGKVLEAFVDDDGVTNIVAHVVDPLAITKVKTGVYAGFSIGGKVTARDTADRTIITGLRLIEISLVDSPCNPDAVLSMWKADTMKEFKPASADVITRAKELAKAAATPQWKDFLYEAGQQLMAEHLLKSGEIANAEADTQADTGADNSAAETGQAADPPADPPVDDVDTGADTVAAAAGAEAVTTDDPAAAGGDNDDPTKVAAPAAEPAAVEPAAEVDPAAAVAAALDTAKAAAAAAEAQAAAEPVDLFADLGKAAAALRGITVESPLLAKSMWHVGRLADLLDSFASLQQCVKAEADREGDGSAVPQALADQIKAMGATLVTMAQEEVAELLADDPEVQIIYVGDDCCYSQQIVDLVKANTDLMEKAGARHSKADAKHLQTAHDSLVKMGAVCEKDDMESAASAEQITTLTAENERLSKALAEAAPAVDEVTATFTGIIDTLKNEVADLRKRFDDEPLPPKTAGPAAVVGKANDSTGNGGGEGDEPAATEGMTDEQFQKAWAELPEAERGNILLKLALARPQAITPARAPAAA